MEEEEAVPQASSSMKHYRLHFLSWGPTLWSVLSVNVSYKATAIKIIQYRFDDIMIALWPTYLGATVMSNSIYLLIFRVSLLEISGSKLIYLFLFFCMQFELGQDTQFSALYTIVHLMYAIVHFMIQDVIARLSNNVVRFTCSSDNVTSKFHVGTGKAG